MNQKTYDDTFLEMAYTISKLSKCVSKQVGCVIVKDNHPVCMSYNGTFCNNQNCDQVFDRTNFDRETHHKWAQLYEIHAEMNAIGFAAKEGISLKDTTLYCTLQPCNDCLKNIVSSGIKRIIFSKYYDKCVYQPELLTAIKLSGISLEQPTTLRN